MQQRVQVDASLFPMVHCFNSIQAVGAADHFVQRAEAKFRHPFAQILGDKLH